MPAAAAVLDRFVVSAPALTHLADPKVSKTRCDKHVFNSKTFSGEPVEFSRAGFDAADCCCVRCGRGLK